MRHLNAVFHDVQKRIAWSAFDKLVDAQEIADLHKRRCDIELFFRLMKQTPRIQIAVALIAYPPLSALRKICDVETSPFQIVRLVRGHLMHRKLSLSFEHA